METNVSRIYSLWKLNSINCEVVVVAAEYLKEKHIKSVDLINRDFEHSIKTQLHTIFVFAFVLQHRAPLKPAIAELDSPVKILPI